MNRWPIPTLSVAVMALGTGFLHAGETPRVLELRTQKVQGITYFHVRLERPADLRLPTFDTGKPFSERDRRQFARLPRLVPQDEKTRNVYYRRRATQSGLSFYGHVMGSGKARFLLFYPLTEPAPQKKLSLADLARTPGTAETAVELDFDKARSVPAPVVDPEDQHVHPDDLRSYWALHQAAHFAVLETQVVDFNFYSFAREATGRKYNVIAPAWVRRQTEAPEHRLYEITTGADAVAETLQLHRLLQPEAKPSAERSLPIANVEGITVPPQPWDRMLGGKKPAVESIAHLIPHDNYYVYFKNIRKFLEFGDLLDQWGTNVLRVYEMKSRDAQLRQRYEKQLCLRSTALGRLLGPAVVKAIAVTGSDPYVREGTDITVVFEVANPALFRGAVEGFLKEARQEQGGQLREGREEYQDTTIETFVTPLREVSLHRATLGDFVIYANSPAGVRRVIDAQRKGGKCLADANDFKYMRTIFPLAGDKEDGFVFLSDAFIRQLTGPACRIKEKRRLEALTSLYMVTNAALFCAWETGKAPADLKSALAAADLRPDDVPIPEVSSPQAPSSDEGKKERSEHRLRWDPDRQIAVSDAYNTIHFATPLIELPIDKITPAEAQEYARFRDEYARLWRTYFDPIGVRLSLDPQRVRVETHILPLAGSDAYRALRDTVGMGRFKFEPRAAAVVDFQLGAGGDNAAIAFRVDGDALLREMVELLIRWDMDPRPTLRSEYDRLFWKLPLGLSLRGKLPFDKGVEGVIDLLKQIGLVKGDTKESRHRNVVLHRLPISEEKYREIAAIAETVNPESPFATVLSVLPTREAPAALYVALHDETLHLSANEDFLKKRIDEAEARKKAEEKKPAIEANSGLYISPANAGEAASLFLEYEGHNLALLNNQVWNCFHRTGLLTAQTPEAARRETVLRLLGFIPVSPDGSTYRYDARSSEVVNQRHGSLRRPELHSRLAESSELGQFLKQIKALRVELRFLDNGLHTLLTIERK
jgi:hypothetical protein